MSSSGRSRGLGDGIDTHMLILTIEVPKTTRDRLQVSLVVGHIVIVRESTLGSDISKCYDTTPFVHCIILMKGLAHLMERKRRNVPALGIKVIVRLSIRDIFTYIDRHTYGV